MNTASLGATAMVLALLGCAGNGASDARYPPRPEGCDVLLFHEAPTMPTDNLGPVRSRCDNDIAEADCLRALEDQTCKLGGNVVWGVPIKPEDVGGKKLWSGRSAHTREASRAVTPAHSR